MAMRLGVKHNYRIIVEPRRLGSMGFISMSDSMAVGGRDDLIPKEYESRCNEIADQIKRHVDSVGRVSVEFDQERECEHCGWRWTEDSATYNGGCCDADENGKEV